MHVGGISSTLIDSGKFQKGWSSTKGHYWEKPLMNMKIYFFAELLKEWFNIH